MYGLPKDFDTNLFLGRNLELICFSENQVTFHFDGELRLTALNAFSYRRAGPIGSEQTYEFPIVQTDVLEVLGSSIVQTDRADMGSLTLTFENSQRITFFDNSSEYESYIIDYHDSSTVI